MIRKSKSEFYLKSVTENLNNPSKFWKIIKSMSGTHVASSLPQYIQVDLDKINNKVTMINQLNKNTLYM